MRWDELVLLMEGMSPQAARRKRLPTAKKIRLIQPVPVLHLTSLALRPWPHAHSGAASM